MLNLGIFQGNDLDQVFLNYEILSTSDKRLIDNFSVKCTYKNDEVNLEIDLKLMDADLVDQSVSGVLSIMNLAKE